jgi:hypothetical protein
MTDIIKPVDAFRMILRAIYPQNPRLPARIKSPEFFVKAQRKYKFRSASEYEPPFFWGEAPPPDHVWKPFEAMHALRVGVWQQKIALQGELNAAPPAWVNPAHCAIGDLDVFAQTLMIGKTTAQVDYRYERVWCARAGVLALVAEYVPGDAPRKLGSKSGAEYVATYIREDLNPTIDGFRARALKDKIKGARKFEKEYHKQMAERGVATRVGRRRKLETLAN